MNMLSKISIDGQALAEFCRQHGIRKLSLFGSALREDFGPDSDLDFLVEFEQGVKITYLDLAEMEITLAKMLKTERRIDLRTPRELSRYFPPR